MKFTDFMIDLETLGTTPGSVITQIGVCGFNPRSDDPTTEGFFVRVDPQSALDAGLTVSWATISWWLTQEQAAREKMASNQGAMSLYSALEAMNKWIKDHSDPAFCVWGNGSSFDITLLEVALSKVGMKPIWSYRNIRDQRTLTHLAPVLDLPHATPLVAHDAMEDAIAQAMTVRLCIREIEGLGKGRP